MQFPPMSRAFASTEILTRTKVTSLLMNLRCESRCCTVFIGKRSSKSNEESIKITAYLGTNHVRRDLAEKRDHLFPPDISSPLSIRLLLSASQGIIQAAWLKRR